IIVNDGSTDNSLDLVAKYKNEHEELNICIINKVNGGVASARNAGIKVAKGEFIALLDSDDEWLVNKLKTIMPYFNNKEIDCIGSSRNGRILKCGFKTIKKTTQIYPHDLVFRWNPQTSSVVFRKSIVEKIGLYNENMKYAEDGEYWLRIAHYCRFFVIPDSLVITGGGKHDYGESGLSGNLKKMHIGELKAIYSAYNMRAITLFSYYLARIFAMLKYMRRKIFVAMRT
ncbi:MAG: glycosyltransferase, partial [Bacteroidales bacterium]|nr:glycosyltransferase [Bacteroidales bacterium]